MTTPEIDLITNSPVIPGMGRPVPEQVFDARCREPYRRTRKPDPGDAVWYRHIYGGTLHAARVVAVLEQPEDPSTHRYVISDPTRGPDLHPVTNEPLRELVDDPWWSVRLKVDGMPGTVDTREARIAGSPGWLEMER